MSQNRRSKTSLLRNQKIRRHPLSLVNKVLRKARQKSKLLVTSGRSALRSESTTSGQSVEEVKPEPGLSEDRVLQSPKSEGAPMSDDMLIKSEDSLKTPSDETGRGDLLDGERALKYVRRELRRWKDMDAGRVVPPSVEYVWPTTNPSVDVFQKAAAATGDYIKWQCSSVFPEDMWISEFH
ncbi:Hypothetical protein PHPALM_19389, partial [Phytophthora palmivora]